MVLNILFLYIYFRYFSLLIYWCKSLNVLIIFRVLGLCVWRRDRGPAWAWSLQQHSSTETGDGPEPVCSEEGGCTLRGTTRHGTHCGRQGKGG